MPRRSPWTRSPGTGVRASNRRCRVPTRTSSDGALPLILQARMKSPHFHVVGLEELRASAQKHQSTIVKHPDAGTEQQRLAEFLPQVEELLLQFDTSHRIKRTKGFIQQQ